MRPQRMSFLLSFLLIGADPYDCLIEENQAEGFGCRRRVVHVVWLDIPLIAEPDIQVEKTAEARLALCPRRISRLYCSRMWNLSSVSGERCDDDREVARGWGRPADQLGRVMLTAGSWLGGRRAKPRPGPTTRKALVERWGREAAEYTVVAHSEPERS